MRAEPHARRDHEELGGDEVELGRQGEEARVERGLGFGLLEGLAVVEVGVREDAPEAPGEGREVAVGGLGDGQSDALLRGA